MNTDDLFTLPVLPYAGTSGHSGSDTSKSRALLDDATGKTKQRQQTVVTALSNAGPHGMTWKELAHRYGWHHGQASGALSVLHKEGLICRLSERRDRCKVYVIPEYVYDRQTEKHGGSIQGRSRKQQEACMLSERQADILINGHDVLVSQVSRTLETDQREKAEKVIATIADWLSDYRPQEFGDDYCSPLDVTAFILRKGQSRE
jgi:hypothetical protein